MKTAESPPTIVKPPEEAINVYKLLEGELTKRDETFKKKEKFYVHRIHSLKTKNNKAISVIKKLQKENKQCVKLLQEAMINSSANLDIIFLLVTQLGGNTKILKETIAVYKKMTNTHHVVCEAKEDEINLFIARKEEDA